VNTAEEIVRSNGGRIVSVAPQATIDEALQVMVENKIGAVLVRDGEEIVGIWTERDLLTHAVEEGFDPKKALVGDYMVTDIHPAAHDQTVYQLMDHFLGLHFRHMPVMKDGECLGVLSVGDVMKAVLGHKDLELKELNSAVSWEYYENWRW